ncbi:MAG: LamG-like jellyroll fold domain-containing protein [Oligosphaeraceae bacterium]
MPRKILTLLILCALCALLPVRGIAASPASPIDEGAVRLGYWPFSGDNPGADHSGNGFHGELFGGASQEILAEGTTALVPNRSENPADVACGLVIASHAKLTPKGAFTFEIAFQLSEIADTMKSDCFFLVDKKGFFSKNTNPNGNQGYNLYLQRRAPGKYELRAWLGFGAESLYAASPAVEMKAGEWHLAALTYDGRGKMTLFLDGKEVRHAEKEDAKDIAPGNYRLCLGDRAISRHFPFTGKLAHAVLYQGIPLRYGGMPPAPAAQPRSDFPFYDQMPEEGEDQGAERIGVWNFSNPDMPGGDASGHGWKNRLSPMSVVQEYAPGKHALEVCPGEADGSTAYGLTIYNQPDFVPQESMALELWFCLDQTAASTARNTFFLVDKKGYHYKNTNPRGNGGYCLLLRRGSDNQYTLELWLGFGDESAQILSDPMELPPDVWHKVAFTYNGRGVAALYMDGECLKQSMLEGKGALAQSDFHLTLGDRSVANYSPLAGMIAQVVLYQGIPQRYASVPTLEPIPGRRVFQRFEGRPPHMKLSYLNSSNEALEEVRFFAEGRELSELRLENIPYGATKVLPAELDLSRKPGDYVLALQAQARTASGQELITRCQVPYTIIPRPAPFMPVVMWNIANDLPWLAQLGFTHDLVNVSGMDEVLAKSRPVHPDEVVGYASDCRRLNERAALGLHSSLWVRAGSWLGTKLKDKDEYFRVNRRGERITTATGDVTQDVFRNFTRDVCLSMAEGFADFGSVDSALIHSEVRDHSEVSFHPAEVAAAEKALGGPIPALVERKQGVSRQRVKGFPVDGILPESDPILRFYQWFWKTGDGWNDLHSLANDALKSTGRTDIWTFFDPAVRTPSTWGSGGNVDVLSQWTYSYPDPIKVGQATDELFAMAQGNPRQKVMTMTQVIWYRYRVAPREQLPENEADCHAPWEREIPDAKFVTISPDHMEIALWSMLSRPVKGIMYHGWNSLTGRQPRGNSGYEFTNPETQVRLAALLKSVVKPLGPMLLQVEDAPPKVALLESFSSQIYVGGGTWGWSDSWEADLHLAFQWAGFPPAIVYEESLRAQGVPASVEVLVMPNCPVLPRDVLQAIRDFQERGGILVADETLTPALIPDLTLPRRNRTRKAQEDKAAFQEYSRLLRKTLTPYVQMPFETSDLDLVGRMRQNGECRYLFLVNDNRTFGEYLGQYGLVMEKGLPLEGEAWVQGGGHVFDLRQHEEVRETVDRKDGVSFPVRFGAGEGGCYLVTRNSLARLELQVPPQGRRGERLVLKATVSDEAEAAPDGVIPLEVTLLTPEGEPAERTGFYGAPGGVLEVPVDLAPNDDLGVWSVQVRNLANGVSASEIFQVVE